MLTPEQTTAINEQFMPVLIEAATTFLRDELGIIEADAIKAAEAGAMAAGEAMLAVLNSDAPEVAPETQPTEPAPTTEPMPSQNEPAPVAASFETRAGRKIAATTMSLIMDGVGMINEGQKKIKRAIDTERNFSIEFPVKMDAETILNTIEWK